MSVITEVKSRLDLVETISRYVPGLRRRGRTWKALCPFHNERTASFIVDPTRGSWHCFGACSSGGDVIDFVRRAEGLDVREAISRCADLAGVELRPASPEETRRRRERERLFAANEAAALFFRSYFLDGHGEAARAYARGRNLDPVVCGTWGLGYAPDEWQALTDHLAKRGFTTDAMLAAGLVVEGEHGVYDRFRERLMFPIRDVASRIIGFGARSLHHDQEPKYLNTPQTDLFDKSAVLYGIERAGASARRADVFIVVEGYLDAIACNGVGIDNAVAVMGTAITERQMRLAKRFTSNIVLAMDADAAGAEATLRALDAATATSDRDTVAVIDWRGLISYQQTVRADIRIAALPPGDDPDSLAASDPDRLRAAIAEATPLAEHLFAHVAADIDPGNPADRSRAVTLLAPTVATMADPITRAGYIQRLARMAHVGERVINENIAKLAANSRRPSGRSAIPHLAVVAPSNAESPAQEVRLLALMIMRPDCWDVARNVDPDTFEQTLTRHLFELWRDAGGNFGDEPDSDDDIAQHLRDIERIPLPAGYAAMTADEVSEIVSRTAAGIRVQRLRERLREAALSATEELTAARRDGDDGAAQTILDELEDISTQQRVLAQARTDTH